ncbi:hypothetical protein AXG93_868s1600 [Marchantia polymorpha subsp. ruderalis]|uniref:Uncharacterized protein n=1 Tax=Marchantia polymorpha subsp. ruderalis TaxID=1480154 RepID=A0A176VLY9_MARPO|nr:hypothetical protein AXG93_868s1600 [Marchantia polymorpha subsp. ruderalis]
MGKNKSDKVRKLVPMKTMNERMEDSGLHRSKEKGDSVGNYAHPATSAAIGQPSHSLPGDFLPRHGVAYERGVEEISKGAGNLDSRVQRIDRGRYPSTLYSSTDDNPRTNSGGGCAETGKAGEMSGKEKESSEQ